MTRICILTESYCLYNFPFIRGLLLTINTRARQQTPVIYSGSTGLGPFPHFLGVLPH